MEGDGITIPITAGRAGGSVACAEGHPLVEAEVPVLTVAVLHDRHRLRLGKGYDFDALGRIHAVEDQHEVGLDEAGVILRVDGVVGREGAGAGAELVRLELRGRCHRDPGHLVGGDGHGGDVSLVRDVRLDDAADRRQAILRDSGKGLRTSHILQVFIVSRKKGWV